MARKFEFISMSYEIFTTKEIQLLNGEKGKISYPPLS